MLEVAESVVLLEELVEESLVLKLNEAELLAEEVVDMLIVLLELL